MIFLERNVFLWCTALERETKHWSSFKNWLAGIAAAESVNVIIDGANIGYYKQNFAGAPEHIDYKQVQILYLKFHF